MTIFAIALYLWAGVGAMIVGWDKTNCPSWKRDWLTLLVTGLLWPLMVLVYIVGICEAY